MTTDISETILRILGEVPTSQLPNSDHPIDSGEYLFYDPTSKAFTKSGGDLVDYLCHQVYAFLFKKDGIRSRVILTVQQQSQLTSVNNGQPVSFSIKKERAGDDYDLIFSNIDGDPTRSVSVGKCKMLPNGTFILQSVETDWMPVVDLERILGFTDTNHPVIGTYSVRRSIYPEEFLDDTFDDPFSFNRRLLDDSNDSDISSWIGKATPGTSQRNLSDVWFQHFQYFYLGNLSKEPPTMLVKYTASPPDGATYIMRPTMWDTNLTDQTTSTNLPWFPFNESVNKAQKRLYIPAAAIRSGRFRKSSYYKIVTGGWDVTNHKCDYPWSVEGCVTRLDENNKWNDTLPPEPNLVYDYSGSISGNLGDIDQTLKALEEYVDDISGTIEATPHDGKVVLTAFIGNWNQSSKKEGPFPFDTTKWKNVLSFVTRSSTEAFICSGQTELPWSTYSNNVTLTSQQLAYHSHNTVPGGYVNNVSFIGQPEGNGMGGFAITNSAELWSSASSKTPSIKLVNDEHQTISSGKVTLAALSSGTKGPYTGTVMYDSSNIKAEHTPHNNMPVYYKIRGYVYFPNRIPNPPPDPVVIPEVDNFAPDPSKVIPEEEEQDTGWTTHAVRRFFSKNRNDHFYTDNEAEVASLTSEWREEGVAFYAYSVNDNVPNTKPVYRFNNSTSRDHFYTADPNEAAELRLYPEVWTKENCGFRVYLTKPEGINVFPIYRAYNQTGGDHFYTASETEANSLGSDWIFEGIAFYAFLPET